MNAALAELLHHPLVWRGDNLAPAAGALPSGFAELDRELPGGGWPRGGLTELLTDEQGIGELRLLVPALRGIVDAGGWLALVAPPHIPYAPAFAGCGIDPRRVIVVTSDEEKHRWWAAEQVLRANCAGALLFWPRSLGDQRLRRLQLAAQEGDAAAFVVTGTARAEHASPAPLRLRLRASATRGGTRLEIDLFKRRGGVLSRPLQLDVWAPAAPAVAIVPAPAQAQAEVPVESSPAWRRADRTHFARPPAFSRRHPVEGPQARIWNRALAHADEVRRVPPPDPRTVRKSTRPGVPAAVVAADRGRGG